MTKKESTIKKEVGKVIKTEPPKKKVLISTSLSDLHALRIRLEGAEATLSQHVHICLGDDGVHECGLKITQLEVNAQTLSGQTRIHLFHLTFVFLLLHHNFCFPFLRFLSVVGPYRHRLHA